MKLKIFFLIPFLCVGAGAENDTTEPMYKHRVEVLTPDSLIEGIFDYAHLSILQTQIDSLLNLKNSIGRKMDSVLSKIQTTHSELIYLEAIRQQMNSN